MGKFFVILLLAVPSSSFAVVAFSARVNLPKHEIVSSGLAKLSVAWSPPCASNPSARPVVMRTILGSVKNLSCEAESPDSVNQWDTLVAQFPLWGRLWTFEMRESADLVFEMGADQNLSFDLNPVGDARPVERVTMTNVKFRFAPEEKIVCSEKLFDIPVRLINARVNVRARVCEIDQVVSMLEEPWH